MSNSGLNEQEIGRMNSEVMRTEGVSAGHRGNLREMYATVDNTLTDYNPSLES